MEGHSAIPDSWKSFGRRDRESGRGRSSSRPRCCLHDPRKACVTKSPDRPFACVYTSVRPWWTCKRPRSRVPIHSPPSRSRSSLSGLNPDRAPGSGYATLFPSTSCLIPSSSAIRSLPSSSSFNVCEDPIAELRHRVVFRSHRDAIATARSAPLPRACHPYPRTATRPTGRNRCHRTVRCRS